MRDVRVVRFAASVCKLDVKCNPKVDVAGARAVWRALPARVWGSASTSPARANASFAALPDVVRLRYGEAPRGARTPEVEALL